MTRRVLVCGGRDYADYDFVKFLLDQVHAQDPISVVIHGTTRGADALGRRWAAENIISLDPYPTPSSGYARTARGTTRWPA